MGFIYLKLPKGSLRYDLTFAFARHIAMNNNYSLKRYQIGKVYRRDNQSKGRYREFYQCDFDIAGHQYDVRFSDFEAREGVQEKGLAAETADRIGTFVKKRGSSLELLSELKGTDRPFLGHGGSSGALNELELLFIALGKPKSLGKIVFDLSLARVLDYYTGVGWIAAGGRYDNLIGMFSGKQLPAVGVSLGIERVFTIMEQLAKEKNEEVRALLN
ncbi:Histidine--tRNA ligase [Platanthera guangdongensis]|uniref:Histidine--tRNA ligase n=1 Tax=Platanthera guangdongensis TaxID=2320717 RepID=A0ABR2MUV5_9ASPA